MSAILLSPPHLAIAIPHHSRLLRWRPYSQALQRDPYREKVGKVWVNRCDDAKDNRVSWHRISMWLVLKRMRITRDHIEVIVLWLITSFTCVLHLRDSRVDVLRCDLLKGNALFYLGLPGKINLLPTLVANAMGQQIFNDKICSIN